MFSRVHDTSLDKILNLNSGNNNLAGLKPDSLIFCKEYIYIISYIYVHFKKLLVANYGDFRV